MLGYKNWLLRHSDLEKAEEELLGAIKVGFRELSEVADFPDLNSQIESLLISDTIVIWSFKNDPEVLSGIVFLYHFLSCRLCKLGLPLRGALVYGKLRVRSEKPSIVLGNAIVECATIEPKLNAYVVAVHRSIIEYLNQHAITEEQKEIRGFFSDRIINTKEGDRPMPVVAWCMPYVAEMILEAYRLLIDRLRDGDETVFSELDAFLPKLLNSQKMIQTVFSEVDDSERVNELWDVAIDHARSLLEARQIAAI